MLMSEPAIILGIESSCDETAAAVVAGGRTVLSSIIASQHELHEEYQGVVPEIASRAHAERILPVVRSAVAQAGITLGDVRAVAVGNRPGLIGSLLVGVAAAKSLAWSLGVPLVGVDHVHAHLYAGLLEGNGEAAPPTASHSAGTSHAGRPLAAGDLFPALGLVVSGGHTSLFAMASATEIDRLGGTIDDAIGEAYDKVASMLGLPYPGGPVVDKLAQTGNAAAFEFPMSSLSRESLDFSFSGLKTAVKYAAFGVPRKPEPRKAPLPTVEIPPLTSERIADLCAAFQDAATGTIIRKVRRALEQNRGVRSIIVGGGVSANSLLRARLIELGDARAVRVVLPGLSVCLDNAAMIAGLGHAILVSRSWQGDPLSLAAFPASSL